MKISAALLAACSAEWTKPSYYDFIYKDQGQMRASGMANWGHPVVGSTRHWSDCPDLDVPEGALGLRCNAGTCALLCPGGSRATGRRRVRCRYTKKLGWYWKEKLGKCQTCEVETPTSNDPLMTTACKINVNTGRKFCKMVCPADYTAADQPVSFVKVACKCPKMGKKGCKWYHRQRVANYEGYKCHAKKTPTSVNEDAYGDNPYGNGNGTGGNNSGATFIPAGSSTGGGATDAGAAAGADAGADAGAAAGTGGAYDNGAGAADAGAGAADAGAAGAGAAGTDAAGAADTGSNPYAPAGDGDATGAGDATAAGAGGATDTTGGTDTTGTDTTGTDTTGTDTTGADTTGTDTTGTDTTGTDTTGTDTTGTDTTGTDTTGTDTTGTDTTGTDTTGTDTTGTDTTGTDTTGTDTTGTDTTGTDTTGTDTTGTDTTASDSTGTDTTGTDTTGTDTTGTDTTGTDTTGTDTSGTDTTGATEPEQPPPPPPCPAGEVSCAGIDEVNVARNGHGTAESFFDATQAANAQAWAQSLATSGVTPDSNTATWKDSSNDGSFGEAVWIALTPPLADLSVLGVAAAQTFYQQKSDYNHLTGECSTGSDCSDYTQMMWAASTGTGIGVVQDCQTGQLLCTTYVVMRFSPAGNTAGEFVANVLPPTSRFPGLMEASEFLSSIFG